MLEENRFSLFEEGRISGFVGGAPFSSCPRPQVTGKKEQMGHIMSVTLLQCFVEVQGDLTTVSKPTIREITPHS